MKNEFRTVYLTRFYGSPFTIKFIQNVNKLMPVGRF